jgi:hypothetical protein
MAEAHRIHHSQVALHQALISGQRLLRIPLQDGLKPLSFLCPLTHEWFQ